MRDDTRQFETGAECSKDGDDTPFYLITPIGLREVAKVYASEVLPVNPEDDVDGMIGTALFHTFEFLRDGNVEDLASATVAVFEAIALDIGEDREDFLDLPTETFLQNAYARIPYSAWLEVASAYAEGCIKYKPYNCEKGLPAHVRINHAIRHLLLYLRGDATDSHLGHAAWGLLFSIHSVAMWPELNRPHLRRPGCLPPLPEPEAEEKLGEARKVTPPPTPGEFVTIDGAPFDRDIHAHDRATDEGLPEMPGVEVRPGIPPGVAILRVPAAPAPPPPPRNPILFPPELMADAGHTGVMVMSAETGFQWRPKGG